MLKQKLENGVPKSLPPYWRDSTNPLPGEKNHLGRLEYPGTYVSKIEKYFSFNYLGCESFVKVQRHIDKIYHWMFYQRFNGLMYYWNMIGYTCIFLCCFLRPYRIWILVSGFVFMKIIFPSLISWAQLRLTLPGLPLFAALTFSFYGSIFLYVVKRIQKRFKTFADRQIAPSV